MATRYKTRTIPYEDELYEYLSDPEEAVAYLTACYEDDHPGTFLVAVRDVVAVYGGVGAMSRGTSLNRENLYKMLSDRGNPSLDSLRAIFEHLGVTVTFGAGPKLKARAKKRRPATKRRSAA